MKDARLPTAFFVLVLCSLLCGQTPYGCESDSEAPDSDCKNSIQHALDMVGCCAMMTLDQELMECVGMAQENCHAGKIVLAGTAVAGGYAWTNADNNITCQTPPPPHPCLEWTSSSACNCIVINTFYTNDDCEYSSNLDVSAAILGAILMHEMCHAKSLDIVFDPSTGTWSVPCDLSCNELKCYCKELDLLNCMWQHCLSAINNDFAANRERVQEQKQAYQEACNNCGGG